MLFIPCRPLPLSGGVAEWCNFAGDQCIANDNSGAHSIPLQWYAFEWAAMLRNSMKW